MYNTLLLLVCALLGHPAIGQKLTPAQLENLSRQALPAAADELKALLALPNDAIRPADVDRNLAWLKTAFEKRGFAVRILPVPQGLPLLYAERKAKGVTATTLYYAHLDGQPVLPAEWQQPNPYQAVLRQPTGDGQYQDLPWETLRTGYHDDWRIFARSSADDKGPIVMLLTALDILDRQKIPLNAHVKVILDSEEEKGSRGLLSSIEQYKSLLTADRLLVMDGPQHASNRPTLSFGCRGIASVLLTVYGPKLPQHSGHYGNYAPNPGFRLARLLATMKDDQGRVLIDGYYDGIALDEEATRLMAAVPDDAREINQRLGITQAERVGSNYQESLQYPSLNVRGLKSAEVGAAATTVVPAEAAALLDLRLVPETDGKQLVDKLRQHVVKQGFLVLDRPPTDAERLAHDKIATLVSERYTPAFRTATDSPTGKFLIGALAYAFDSQPVVQRTMGGTVPIEPMIRALAIPAVMVPLVNLDNNQHSPNENLRLVNLKDGIRTCLALLSYQP